ncbi:sialate O-acetylesterase [Rudanella paleaurantiibacter]|uniref:Sialate O-acetylesterase n=1 Tax=Rudanella paleaurantiibacter TaxID=2614655 RepID=A0A7J5TTT0_9BACT|nr:sialate O-acetylesterase [Rudanella paleaurantiibacter]KAB7726875.1 sialate O-acetylesterase [Rudanella paleaurantiibacter]
MKKLISLILLVLGLMPATYAQVRLAEFWQSGMVIQRDQPVHIWGRGIPTQQVRVRLADDEAQTTVLPDSTWSVKLPARRASSVPLQLLVQAHSARLELNHLLVGDVWVCAGQSNMAFPVSAERHAAQTFREAPNPLLRLYDRKPGAFRYNEPFKAHEAPFLEPARYFQPGQWQIADSVSVRAFSAVCYYAGRVVQETVGVPVGLIHMAVGGSPAEAWMAADGAGADTLLQCLFTGDWFGNKALEPWCIQRGHENLDSLLRAGYLLPHGPHGVHHPYEPGFLYEAGVLPLSSLSVKGVMWYQGESNALSSRRVQQHEALFPVLIAQWRRAWNRPKLPFFYCQLSSIGTEKGYKSEYWPLFRDGQRRLAESLPNVGMAVTSDVGHPTDVHPTDKKTVGERLARAMLVQTYKKPLLPSPVPVRVCRRADGWELHVANAGKGLQTADRQAVRGFALGDVTGPHTDLSAQLRGNIVHLTGAQTGQFLYYGWQPYTTANVVNSERFPLSTFKLPLP